MIINQFPDVLRFGFTPRGSTAVPIAGMAWWRPADDARLVAGRGVRAPDEAFPWFVRSPNPVPASWLPTAGEAEKPPPIGRISDQYAPTRPVRLPPAPANTISGMAWWRPADDARLISGRGVRAPDEAFPWFVRSPNPVPATSLPTAGEAEKPPPIGRMSDQYAPTRPVRLPPAPANTISGMAWWRPADDARPAAAGPVDQYAAAIWFVRVSVVFGNPDRTLANDHIRVRVLANDHRRVRP